MGALSTNKGKVAERDLVRYLRTVGFPNAERAVRTGYRVAERISADPGDVTGTPGIIWSCKDCKDERLDAWLAELDAMDGPEHAYRLLVHKRVGKADPGRWWCWMRLDTLWRLCGRHAWDVGDRAPVRFELQHVIPLLHGAGLSEVA